MNKDDYKICSIGLWDTTVPGITFDEEGVSNYCKMFRKYSEQYPKGEKGQQDWKDFVSKIKKSNKKYDCIIGVSGGTDSSYLLHIAKQNGLNPLAVNFDNGWSSDIALKNIKKVTQKLDIDLETYVVDYEEMKDVLKSYMKASLPWIDFPTDHAIKSILYKIARREKVKYILIGQDFRSEGTQPREWTYSDSKQLRYIQRKFGEKKLKSLPNISFFTHLWYTYVLKVKMIYPFFFIHYNKQEAQQELIEKYDWQYYGGHHYENLFTKYAISYWLYEKFNIDKRIITFSAQVLSGKLTRGDALKFLAQKPYKDEDVDFMEKFIIKKLEFTKEDYRQVLANDNKTFLDYPSSFKMVLKVAKFVRPVLQRVMPQLPSFFIQLEERKD